MNKLASLLTYLLFTYYLLLTTYLPATRAFLPSPQAIYLHLGREGGGRVRIYQ